MKAQFELASLHHERGSSLLEALIAMVVVAFGLLGVLALQLSTIKGAQSAQTVSQATLYAYELFDLMRANRAAAMSGDYDDGAGGERAYWQNQLDEALGGGTNVNLVRNGSFVTLTITWNDERGQVIDGDGNASADASGGQLSVSTEI